ncbi:efflux RND transporter periplasmic adaptor subunit [Pseudodonghicola flavimaris]|uniref:Efflux RND transporter periplasmic adaptor subunit n=1 Tax=Pseudodonghicola flavimaris TaxID=3050036 RepID=A0ABT7EYA4_9RHOB|nr:efflux RND transporter periplasmic adaptor subunit [Pseudodonghicola flavimaris]MDK3017334.1 efflux RND transporter periplasmic adaptor subunit [Pseudodonghicola flavimaris]
MKKPFRLIVVLVVIVAAGLGWWMFGTQEDTSVPVTAQATRGSVAETVLASGTIEAKQLVSVGARVSGQIETLAVSLGQEVAKGDLIAEIDSQDQQNAVLTAEAALANIEAQIAAKQANLKQAELTLNRQKSLGEREFATQETIESATANVLVYTAELKALEAEKSSAEVTVSTAKIALERTRITAPISGTVVAIVVEEGQTVNATQAAPTIVKLANLDQMVVKAEISEADVVHVAPGQEVSFTILGEPETAFEAVVRAVEPAPSEIEDSDTINTDEAIYYNGLLDVDNPGHKLRIGMTTQVSIVLARADDVLTVPSAALRRGEGGYTVEIWDPQTQTGRVQRVEVGLNDKVTAEITSGLSEGDLVVTGTAVAAASSSGGRMGPPMGF